MLALPGSRVSAVREGAAELVLRIEASAELVGCPGCGVVVSAQDCIWAEYRDLAAFGRPARLLWAKCRSRCEEPACAATTCCAADSFRPSRSADLRDLRRRRKMALRVYLWVAERHGVAADLATEKGATRRRGCRDQARVGAMNQSARSKLKPPRPRRGEVGRFRRLSDQGIDRVCVRNAGIRLCSVRLRRRETGSVARQATRAI